MKKMNVLIACEESQTVCKAFREKGHNAFSCDIQEPSGGHPEWHFLGDALPLLSGGRMLTMDGVCHEIDHWDLLIAHPPCFVAGTKVMTYEGIKSIEDIKIGDLVLTHKGRYRKVTDVMSRSVSQLAEVHTENCGRIKCTPNHPFYVQNLEKEIIDSKRVRGLKEFEWLPPSDFIAERGRGSDCNSFKKKTYTTTVTDFIEELPEYNGAEVGVNQHKKVIKNTLQINSRSFWYLVGRWLGDGWFYYQYSKGNKRLAGIKICCDKHEAEYLKTKIQEAGFAYTQYKERTVDKFEIANKELGLYMKQFGEYAYGKFIPGFVLRLPEELAKSFIDGYIETDGCCDEKGRYSFSTVSADLAYGMKYMINKYYRTGCSIKPQKNHNDIIEGRKCNTRLLYTATFDKQRKERARYLVSGQYILAPFRSVQILEEKAVVYNLSVEEDESYTANGIVVHNCTFMCNTSAMRMRVKGQIVPERYEKAMQARAFFMEFYNSDIPHIAIENPVPMKLIGLPPYTQIIQPYEYGHPYSKRTCLWLKGLPKLKPTKIIDEHEPYINGGYKDAQGKYKRFPGRHERDQTVRSRTFPGIAQAMVDQWSDLDDYDE